jgi:hypothetical protein
MKVPQTWKDRLRSALPWKTYWTLKRLREEWRAFFSPRDLTSLAIIYQTDKWGRHAYTPIYTQWFGPLRYKPIHLLEIGVGGNTRAHAGGNSLRMWKYYFPKGMITGIDIHDKSALKEHRIHIYQGNQADASFLIYVNTKEGPFDIIIDDGSHMQSHIIASFETLFPLLKPGGIYVIEDTHTSYHPSFEGSTSNMFEANTAMNYFIQRIHVVNRADWAKDEKQPHIPDQGIASISFYHNMIFIVKK